MFWMILACTQLPETVKLSGLVYDAPYLTGDILANEPLRTLDLNLTEVGSTTSAEDGSFQIDVPAGEGFFMVLEGDSHPPTAFSGSAGFVDLGAGDGLPWAATTTLVDTIKSDFSACSTYNETGAIVTGEVRLYVSAAAGPWDMPAAPLARVTITGSDGTQVPACVLDDEGISVASGEMVGATGRFAAFGIPEGPLLVGLAYDDGSGLQTALNRGYAPEEGVAAFYPLYVGL